MCSNRSNPFPLTVPSRHHYYCLVGYNIVAYGSYSKEYWVLSTPLDKIHPVGVLSRCKARVMLSLGRDLRAKSKECRSLPGVVLWAVVMWLLLDYPHSPAEVNVWVHLIRKFRSCSFCASVDLLCRDYLEVMSEIKIDWVWHYILLCWASSQ